MNYVILETKDKQFITIDYKVLQRSKVIQDMFTYSCDEQKDQIVPIYGINHDILLKILLWLEYHKDDTDPDWVWNKEEPSWIEHQIDDWDKEFLREKLSTIRFIIKGADYLDIHWLVKLCAHKLRMRGSAQLYFRAMATIAPID